MTNDPSSQPTQPLTEPTGQEILATPMGDNDAGAATIRDYLLKLLKLVWAEQEGFNGKRPFGNSDWSYELHGALLDAGFIDGERDEDGWIDSVDDAKGHGLICKAIRALGLDQDGEGQAAKRAEPDPVHFAPYGGSFTTCGEALPKNTPWSATRGDFDSDKYATRRAETTCPQCRSALGLDQDGEGQAVPKQMICPGCGELLYLDPMNGWRNDTSGYTCKPPSTVHTDHIDLDGEGQA